MKNLIKLFIFFLFISGCTKIGKTVTIKGRVLNPITGEGIAGAKIKLLRTTLGLPGGNKAIKTVVSDVNGDYELSKLTLRYLNLQWNAPEGQEYLGLGFKDSETGEAMGTHVKKFKIQHWDYHAVPYGELKISVHNINCLGALDTFYYERIYNSFDIDVFQPFTFTGCYNNEGAFAKVPIGEYLVRWTVTRLGISNIYTQILNVNEGTQTIYNIDY